jgi:ribokinase
MRTAVIGHLEWCEFLPVERVPRAGEILETESSFTEPAGGGAVAAVQLARLSGDCTFFTAVGDDENGHRVEERLAELGVHVHAVHRPDQPTRRAFVYLDADGERTITTIGERLEPSGDDDLDWGELDGADGVYVTAADAGALRAARAARVLVASPRVGRVLADSAVRLDALVYSDRDELESAFARALEPRPTLLIATRGDAGGWYEAADGETGTWRPAPVPAPIADTYGSGDSFAAALTYGLAAGEDLPRALELAAEAGAANLARRGPYG